MRILLLVLAGVLCTGCGMTAYNPHFIISDGPQVTVEARDHSKK